MQDSQNFLYINLDDPWNAVIFDRTWLETRLRDVGLGIIRAWSPVVRGFQWIVQVRHLADGHPVVDLPSDEGPFGRVPRPISIVHPSTIGSAPAG